MAPGCLDAMLDAALQREEAMQAALLMGIYILTTITLQFAGFGISQLVSYQWPTMGLMTFLMLFMVAFGVAWPVAVRIAEWAIQRFGFVVDTEQSGGATARRM
jgi:uncharacterized membrane protein YkvI